jgi:Bacteriophage HK97-gp10, putative tail-component
MTRVIKAEFEGARDVLARLAKLRPGRARTVLRKALNEATKPVLDAAKAQAPRQSGLLKKSLGRIGRTYVRSNAVVFFIGPRTGFRRAVTIKDRVTGKTRTMIRNPVNIGHLTEGGRKAVRARRRVLGSQGVWLGRFARAVAAGRWLRRAWGQTKAKAESIFIRRAWQEIQKLVASGKG